jgi:hypothetical protein
MTELRECDWAELAAVDGGGWVGRLWNDIKSAFRKHAKCGALGIVTSALTSNPFAGLAAYVKCQVL